MAVTAITVFYIYLTPWWSGLDTPDSEFYASLAVFTNQITDRAPIDSYFWTRLGLITPVHVLIKLLGIWAGFAVFKILLLAILTSSIYMLTRCITGFWCTTWITGAVLASSVMLSYLGNPYITGSVMAGTAALAALSIHNKLSTAMISGLVLGWMAMVYPGGALLGGSIWLALRVYQIRTDIKASVCGLLRYFATVTAFTLLSMLVFWLSGHVLFPGLNWFDTYIEASRFDFARYSSGEWVWLRDISLLVPASVFAIATINAVAHRRNADPRQRRAAEWALIISATSIGFFLVYSPLFGAHFLEAPPSQAMLWPPAMMATALIAASRMATYVRRSLGNVFVPAIGLMTIVAAGHVDLNLTLAAGWFLAVALVALVTLAPQRTLITFITTTMFLSGAQLLQNSREPLGQFMLDPYTWAYLSNPNEQKMRIAVNAQQWLLDTTVDGDKVLLWVDGQWTQGDRELYTVAAMQLWGDNRITLAPTLTDDYAIETLESVRPTVLVMNGRSMATITAFYDSIPRERRPSTPVCYDYLWPVDPVSAFPTTVGHTCVTRLDW